MLGQKFGSFVLFCFKVRKIYDSLYLEVICSLVKFKTTYALMALALISVILSSSCQQMQKQGGLAMEHQLQNQLGLYIDSCWNNQDIKEFGMIATADFTRNLNGIRVAKNTNEMEAHMKVFITAFPDLKILLEETEIKGRKIFLLWQSTGTNTGVYGEIGATGKKVKINGMSHLYFDEAGKLYREDVYFNELDLLQQLGYSFEPPNME